jgi:hypothetical protein
VNNNYEYDEIVEEDIEKEIDLMCGGTVIDNFSIITTARCCSDIKSSLTPTPIISLGLDRLLRPAQNMTIHPLWTDGIEDGADRNDVCVIQVEKDLFYSGDEQLSTGKVENVCENWGSNLKTAFTYAHDNHNCLKCIFL